MMITFPIVINAITKQPTIKVIIDDMRIGDGDGHGSREIGANGGQNSKDVKRMYMMRMMITIPETMRRM